MESVVLPAPPFLGDYGDDFHNTSMLPCLWHSTLVYWMRRGLGRRRVRGLNWELKKLCDEKGSGAYTSQRERSYVLRGVANELHGLGYKGLRAEGIRRKHVVALVRSWKTRGLSVGTIKNRTAHVRWWARQVGHARVVPSNAELGIERRVYVTNEDKSRQLDAGKLAEVRDPYVAMSPAAAGGAGAAAGGSRSSSRRRTRTGGPAW